MRWISSALGGVLVMSALGCRKAPPPGGAGAAEMSLAGPVWTLAQLGEQSSPMGAGNRPPDIRFDGVAAHAAGFAGCNRFGGSYAVTGDSLGFGPVISTKMFCEEGDAVERAFLTMLSSVTTYSVTDSTLTFHAGGVPLARFRAGSSVSE